MKKKMMVFVLLLAFIVGGGTQVFAGIYLDSGAKWSNPKNIRYLNNSSNYSGYVNTGALYHWNNYTYTIEFNQVNNADAEVRVYDVSYPSVSWDGQTTTYNYNGYLTEARVKLNVPKIEDARPENQVNERYRVVNHELGHALGLGDLYSSSSDDVLMYGYTRPEPYKPTYTDITRVNNLYN